MTDDPRCLLAVECDLLAPGLEGQDADGLPGEDLAEIDFLAA